MSPWRVIVNTKENGLPVRAKKSMGEYIHFIDNLRKLKFPIKVQFGLEVCYFPGKEALIVSVLNKYNWDFITGSVHWIDG